MAVHKTTLQKYVYTVFFLFIGHNESYNDNIVAMDGCFSPRKFKSLMPNGKFSNIQKLQEETNQYMDETVVYDLFAKKNVSFFLFF